MFCWWDIVILLLYVFVGILNIVWFGWKSLCDHVVLFVLGIFELLSYLVWNLDNVEDSWSFALYVTYGIVGWILTWILRVLKSWEFDVWHGWANSFLMSVEILLECVGLISWAWKFLWVLLSWVWKIFVGKNFLVLVWIFLCWARKIFVGHGIFFFVLGMIFFFFFFFFFEHGIFFFFLDVGFFCAYAWAVVEWSYGDEGFLGW